MISPGGAVESPWVTCGRTMFATTPRETWVAITHNALDLDLIRILDPYSYSDHSRIISTSPSAGSRFFLLNVLKDKETMVSGCGASDNHKWIGDHTRRSSLWSVPHECIAFSILRNADSHTSIHVRAWTISLVRPRFHKIIFFYVYASVWCKLLYSE